jgi:MarR family transcriptional regulator, transcriptional regulator for hemolysin
MPINNYMTRRPAVPPLGSPSERLTRRMFTRIIASIARALQEHELSVAQLALLYLLDERETMRIGDVATELGLSAPTTSRLVDDLVRQELVARAEDPTDRRARVLSLAPRGRTFIAKSSEARMVTMSAAVADVPASAFATLTSFMSSRKKT